MITLEEKIRKHYSGWHRASTAGTPCKPYDPQEEDVFLTKAMDTPFDIEEFQAQMNNPALQIVCREYASRMVDKIKREKSAALVSPSVFVRTLAKNVEQVEEILSMGSEKREELRKQISEVGNEIQSQLDPLPFHKKRNAYAHIYGAIKQVLGVSYSQADPQQVSTLVEIIRKNPNAGHEDLKEKLDVQMESSE